MNNTTTTLMKDICDALEFTDLSIPSDSMSSIDLSRQNLTDRDLECLIQSIRNNTKCKYFDNIKSINMSYNNFTDNDITDELFTLFGQRFRNLQVLILSHCGINPSLYNDAKLKSLKLSACITWFEHCSDDESDKNAFDFISDDDDDEEEVNKLHTTHTTESEEVVDERDDFIKDSLLKTEEHVNKLSIEYSLSVSDADSLCSVH